MKLKNVIADHALPLGTTVAGQEWCTKALHPADLATPVSVPNEQSRPSAFLAFTGQYKIDPAPSLTAVDTWDCDIILTGDMLCPGCYSKDKSGMYAGSLINKMSFVSGTQNRFLNSQITGTGATPEEAYQAKLTTINQNVREARLAYFGATVELQAPALSDQGTLNCVQYEVPDDDFCACMPNTVSNAVRALKKIKVTHWDQFASFDSIQSLPNAYTGRARDGVYTPMKLSPEDLHFRNMRCTEAVHTDYDASTTSYATDTLSITTSTSLTGPIGCCRDLNIPNLAQVGTAIQDERLPRLTNRISHICVRGMAPTSSLYVTVRSGYEITVSPGSIYSPYVRNPVALDRTALDAYFGISRQLADAYPADYNSLGTLLPIIASIASEVLPSLVPKVAEVVKQLAGVWKNGKERYKAQTDASKQ